MTTDDTAAWIGLDLLGVTFNSVRSPDTLRQPKELLEALLQDGDPTTWLHRKPRHRNWRLTPQTLYDEATRVVRRMHETGIWVQPGIEVPGFIQAPSPPLVVYGWGNRDLLNNRSLGVVGTREPSAMAVARTEKWVSAWVHDGLQIASGGARGIDSVAHRAALRTGGTTVAVLGQNLGPGLNPIRQSWEDPKVSRRFCVLTEYTPWRPSFKGTFVARNRLVAAIGSSVVLMEGRQNSGAIHTLKYAKKMGKTAFVVPTSPENRGGDAALAALLWGLAIPAGTPRQIIDFIHTNQTKMNLSLDHLPQVTIKPPCTPNLKPVADLNQQYVLELLHQHPGGISFEELLDGLSFELPALQGHLTELEFAGRIEQRGALFFEVGTSPEGPPP